MDKQLFFEKIRSFAESNNMTAEMTWNDFHGDWGVKVSYAFKDEFYIIHRSEAYYVKENENGKVNYWHEEIHDGKHRMSGPGYASNAVFKQTPIRLEVLCSRFLNELKQSARYYEPIKRK